jgi:hypothetical protein
MVCHKINNLHLLKLIILLVIISSASGCNSIKKTTGMVIPFYDYDKTSLSTISVKADNDSNGNMPVAIDFAFIYQDTIGHSLLVLSGPEWFANKSGLLLRYEKDLSVVHMEVVPRTMQETAKLPSNYDDAIKVLMFTNYTGPAGQYVADITRFKNIQISLKKSSYQLKEMEQ